MTRAAGLEAAERDRDGAFPAAAFAALHALGCVAAPPLEDSRMPALLRLLAAVGRGDQSVGRIFEGHVNALYLIRRFGSEDQRREAEAGARDGALFGVWNTDVPGNPLVLDDRKLRGGKSFATGIDGLHRAIVTVEAEGGRQMLLVPLDRAAVDRTWWRPLGMRASGSHIVDFTGLEIGPGETLGRPGDYLREPWFSAGAIRFAAVQAGGAHAVLDAARDHLVRTGRADDPYQLHRLARMGLAVETAYGWLATGARAWRDAAPDGAAEAAIAPALAAAAGARSAVEAAAMEVLEFAERGVGAAGMVAPHPLERLVRDMRTYLRQPNPDGALAGLGRAIAAGDWAPGGGLA